MTTETTYPGGTADAEIARLARIARMLRAERDRYRDALSEIAAPGCECKRWGMEACPPIRLPDEAGYDEDAAAPCDPCYARWTLDRAKCAGRGEAEDDS